MAIENLPGHTLSLFSDFEGEFNQALSQLSDSTSSFITSCYSHCHTQNPERWLGEASKLENVVSAD